MGGMDFYNICLRRVRKLDAQRKVDFNLAAGQMLRSGGCSKGSAASYVFGTIISLRLF